MRSAYDEILLAHNLHPAHRGELLGALRKDLSNASCGDKLRVFIELKDNKIVDMKWEGRGCAIALASADLMCEVLKGKQWSDAQKMLEKLPALLHGELSDKQAEIFGEAAALSTVARMPARQACARLAWQALTIYLARDATNR